MEVVATISTTRLFCLSVELTTKNSTYFSTASAWWYWVAPLLVSLLHATVIRPLAIATRHCLKLQDTCICSTRLRRVASEVLRVLLSEQTSLWLLYLMAPHLFDINVKLKVQVGVLLVMLRLLLDNTARLLLRLGLVTGLHHVSTASTHEDAAAAAATDGSWQPSAGEREDGPRRSARNRRPSVRVAGPEWDKRLRGRG